MNAIGKQESGTRVLPKLAEPVKNPAGEDNWLDEAEAKFAPKPPPKTPIDDPGLLTLTVSLRMEGRLKVALMKEAARQNTSVNNLMLRYLVAGLKAAGTNGA